MAAEPNSDHRNVNTMIS